MIEFISSWAKSLGLAIVIVSILEMLLPNNKNKKYIRMVMGIYILFNIVSPFVSNKNIFDIENIDIQEYVTQQETSAQLQSEELNQTSMNKRIEELYIEELEKDITQKLEEQGYVVESCNVKATITDEEEKSGIDEIKINVKKSENNIKSNEENQNTQENIENKIVTEIQKIKKIDTSINNESNHENSNDNSENSNVSKTDIQNIKNFLIEEYEVNEKCLKIN